MVLRDLPVGTVTFLFTDIEGSTPLWDKNPRAMRKSLARHNVILEEGIEGQGGLAFKVIGDAFQSAFIAPEQAIKAAIAVQLALAVEDWGESGEIKVRMGIHMGKAEVRDGDYLASHTLNRVARIMSAGHGGQILLSRAVREMVWADLPEKVSLIDLGEHYLKGISQSEHIFQVQAPGLETEFPPLVTKHSPRGYKLLEQIDEGSFGAVYRAFQPEVNREVAVKIILPKYANNPDFIRRFEFEAQTVARLEHPYIVPLYDYWREPDSAYLVMRWVRGGSLAKRLEAGPLEPNLVAQVVDQVSAALSVAHQHGVVHRDLNAGSILMDEANNAYLSDFGIAKQLAGDGSQLADGDLDGKSSASQPLKNDNKNGTDIYNFGLVIYQMLTGEAPFNGESAPAGSGGKQLTPLPSVRDYCPDLPISVDAVIQKATLLDSNHRYLDAMQLASDFQAALSGLPLADSSRVGVGDGRVFKIHNPYKGLHAFQEADAEDFFGRKALINQLLASLDSRNGDSALDGIGSAEGRFLAVVGPSGSGKSSVVRAGLIPALRRGALPGSDKWFIVDMLPGSNPIEELELGLHRVAIAPVAGLMDQLKSDRRGLLMAAQEVLPDDESELLLVIDQFEEIFTLAREEDETRHFLNLVHSAVVDPQSRVRVVITLRGDFYDRPLRYPEFGELIKEYTSVVLPLNPQELEETMRAPAERVGVELEDQLVATMVADVAEQPGALPLLQYALTELFEQRQGIWLTLEAYHEIGGVLGALGRRAEAVYLNLGEAEQQIARQLFLRLVTLGEGTEDTRRRALRSELTALQTQDSGPPIQLIDSVIEAFGKARLLSFDRDPVSRRPTVEVAHEALIREWSRLRKWLDDGRAEVRMQRALANSAADWLEADRDASFLLRGARLDQFVGWAAETELALTESEEEFMLASLDAHMARLAEEEARQEHEAALERRSRNFLRGLVGVFALATVVAVALSIFALTARNQAQSETNARATQQAIAELEADQRATQQAIAEQEADARATAEAVAVERRDEVFQQSSIRLAGEALGQVDLGQPERSVLLLIAALEEYPYTSQAEKALAQSVVEIADTHLSTEAGNLNWSAVAWSPAGDRVATAIYGNVEGAESYILLQDPQTGGKLQPINLGAGCLGPSNVIWSPSGDRIITVPEFCNESPKIRDARTGELLSSLNSQENQAAFSAAWSPDGRQVITGSLDGSARIWDAESGELDRVIPAHASNEYIHGVAWSPDGEQVATASDDDTAKIWDAATGKLQHTLSGHTDDVVGLAWSPDGEKIATASRDATALVWNIATGEVLFSLNGHADLVWDVAWSPDGDYIATDSRDGSTRVWEAADGVELFQFRNNQAGESVLNSIDWSPQGDRLLSMGSIYNQIWDLSTQPPNLLGHLEGLKAAGWSPDGQYLATASLDGTARIWDAKGDLVRILELGQAVEDLSWSPDSSQLATTSQEGEVRVWQVDSGASREMPRPDGYRFSSLAWSPDGERIAATTSQRDLVGEIWNVETGERTILDQGDLTCYLASPSWSPEGDRLVTGCVRRELKDTPARIWDADTGEELQQMESEDGNSLVVEWSPDGESIAVAYSEMLIHILDADTSQVITRFSGHSDIINDLRWSPNGQRIVSADGGGFARIWDAASGEEVLSFKMTNTLNSVDWSPDGNFVILATLDPQPKIQRVWQSTRALIEYAQECCVWRELTPVERQQFGLPPLQ